MRRYLRIDLSLFVAIGLVVRTGAAKELGPEPTDWPNIWLSAWYCLPEGPDLYGNQGRAAGGGSSRSDDARPHAQSIAARDLNGQTTLLGPDGKPLLGPGDKK